MIKNVDVFNGIDSLLVLNKDVLIRNGYIENIGTSLDVDTTSLKIINGKDKTIMPELIDAHVHLSGSGAVPWENVRADETYNLRAYLYAGVTTIYDLGGLASSISKLARKVENGELIGPSIYNTHIPITIRNSHPIPLTEQMLFWLLNIMVNIISPTIDNFSEAPKIINQYLKNDIDYVKIICD